MRLALALLLLACSQPAKPSPQTSPVQTPPHADRTPAVPRDSAHYALFEGTSFKNGCAADGDCKVGGCGGETCTAEEGVNTACIAYPDQPRDATCGCVAGECIWFRAPGGAAAGGGDPLPAQGQPCVDGKCAAGLSCVSYYGIAGPRGPQFTSCEIPCPLESSKCPDGQKCITIADGPGRVCRPR